MEIRIIAEASTELERISIGWGVSFLIDNNLLFDTFSNETVLKKNLLDASVDIEKVKYVVISHEHWDHIGGVWYILRENPTVKVFVCEGFTGEFKKKIRGFGAEIVEIKDPTEIKDSVFTTGEILSTYNNKPLPEQALVIKNDKLTVITGCAHPGITKILEKVKEDFPYPIGLVLGGFHLMDKSEIEMQKIVEDFVNIGVEKVAPCHCTGEKAVKLFQKEFKEDFIEIKSGVKLKI